MAKLQLSYIKRGGDESLKTIPDCMKFYATTKGDKEAVVFVSDDFSREVVTWSELYEKTRLAARALIRLGVKEDEVVAINIRNCPQWLYLTFGAMMMRARPVGISLTYSDGSDFIAIMEKLKTCSVLAMDPGSECANWNIVKKFVEVQRNGTVSSSKMPYLRYLIGCESSGDRHMPEVMSFNEMITGIADEEPLPECNENDIAFLFQTSGSTGIPKLVTHTHKSLMCVRQLAARTEDMITFNDRPFLWIGGFPLEAMYGWKRVTTSGFCQVPKDGAKFIIEAVKREKCIIVTLLPPMLNELIIRQDELTIDWSIGIASTGGQPLSKHFAKCIGKMVPMLNIGYGATECIFGANAIITNSDKFEENLCGAVMDLPGIELKIVNEKNEVVPVLEKGEVCIRSPAMFKEYYNDPVKTAAVKTPEGWFRTDDIGWLNADGLLYVEGRKSSIIVSGGMNVAPEILERVLESHPAVRSAVIVPLPDEVYHQVLCACMLTNPGCDITEDDLRTFLDKYTNGKPGVFTVLPKYYMFTSEFPQLYSGKTDRKSLASMAMSKFAEVTK